MRALSIEYKTLEAQLAKTWRISLSLPSTTTIVQF